MSNIYKPTLVGDSTGTNTPYTLNNVSLEELQHQLATKLKHTGLLDHLRSQLRAKLIGELQNAKIPLFTIEKGSTAKAPDIVFKAIDSMISQYLSCRQFDFTKSVFLPECGITSEEDVLSTADIEHILQLSADSWIKLKMDGEKRSMSDRNLRQLSESLLVQIVYSLNKLGSLQLRNQPTQTDLTPQEILDMKLEAIDARKALQAKDGLAFEQRLLKAESELAAKIKDDLELEYQKARDMEIAQIRLEERRRHQADLVKLDSEYAQREGERQKRMAEKEQVLLERSRKREQELDEQLNDSRQRLLKELENVKHQEKNLQRDIELATREGKLKEEQLKSKVDTLLKTVEELEAFKKSFSAKVEDQVAHFKLDFERTHQLELTHMRTMQTKLAGEKDAITQQKIHLDTQLTQLSSQSARIVSLEEQLRTANAELQVSRREIEQRDKVIRELGVEARLGTKTKRAETLLEFEVGQLRQQLIQAEKAAEKRQQEYESLLNNIVGASGSEKKQMQALERELLHLKQSEQKWQNESENLVIKLEMELGRNAELENHVDEFKLREKELLSEISDLRLVLHQTQMALRSELHRHNQDISVTKPFIFSTGDAAPKPVSANTIRATDSISDFVENMKRLDIPSVTKQAQELNKPQLESDKPTNRPAAKNEGISFKPDNPQRTQYEQSALEEAIEQPLVAPNLLAEVTDKLSKLEKLQQEAVAELLSQTNSSGSSKDKSTASEEGLQLSEDDVTSDISRGNTQDGDSV